MKKLTVIVPLALLLSGCASMPAVISTGLNHLGIAFSAVSAACAVKQCKTASTVYQAESTETTETEK